MDSTRLADGGDWSAYWYNGYIVGSEIARGLDILELKPSGFISQNEIDAAKSVHFDELNVQGQPKLVWPPTFALARAYVDQLARSNGLSADQISTIRQGLDACRERIGRAAPDGAHAARDAVGWRRAGLVRFAKGPEAGGDREKPDGSDGLSITRQ